MSDPTLMSELQRRGVVVHAPAATVIEDVDLDRIAPGVEIYPGCVVRGKRTILGPGTRLGRAGGGTFENICTGRDVDLYSGYFKDAVFLDGVTVRGHAEMRAGTIMEEGSEAAHHVGYKMTIVMPWVIAGSLVNFCDALVAGGTGRGDHSEIGSAMALYNFTPRGDKFASLFGEVPRGVFLRSARIFVGGQTQVVSPVRVGYGAVLAAGCAVRRSVGEGRLHGEVARAVDTTFHPDRYGALARLFRRTTEYVANLWALEAWYTQVRIPWAAGDSLRVALFEAARDQVLAGVSERVKRLDRLVARLPRSAALHGEALSGDGDGEAFHRRCVAEHERVVQAWPAVRPHLAVRPEVAPLAGLSGIAGRLVELGQTLPELDYPALVQQLSEPEVAAGRADLQRVVDHIVSVAGLDA